ncbi:ADP-ribosylation factor GTPase-activating protein 2 isoform X1 [Stomoxys calcitrans]|uniref:ADP-ribosylation factor GTPase-activating protein 2 isoform X1 n=1 Tax=Stomoxys calcitrans TaxID=35570 RepID=UPI0027E39620|nr:ADP-ribosylation factor GTPase-activating protein 2 isoform X1 [Stomoxys calcitrans]
MANTTSAGPTKQEMEAVFSRLRSQPANKACFDCGAKAPTWATVTYGVFICIDCSAVHRSLGVHLTFVRSTNLDTNWTWLQLRQMQVGGNANANAFFRQHNCNTTDAQQKYNSRAAQLYRDKLTQLAQQAMKVHGTKLFLDGPTEKSENNDNNKEVDFFDQCHNDNNKDAFFDNNNVQSNTEKPSTPAPTVDKQLTGAPSVDLLNSVVNTPSSVTSSIGVRKIQPKKGGMGARKMGGGLGATKVKTNFAEIEQRANMANQLKESPIVPDKPLTAEEEIESVASMRLAYQDLSLKKNQEEARLKSIDPAKAKQMERLGMGFNLKGADISHSVLSDMETIQQAPAPKSTTSSSNMTSSSTKLSAFDNDSFFNDYSTSMYSGSGNGGFSSSSTTNSKVDKQELEMMGFETIEPIGSTHSNITSMFSGHESDMKPKAKSTTPSASSSNYESSYSRKTQASKNNANSSNYDETSAQKKFGSAKGFGSDQFFSDSQSRDDNSSNLSRFQGSTSISSADYFGDGSSRDNRGSRGYNTGVVNFQAPDMDDVKESVRQGVHKVAGRLSSLANDVMSSLQDKYGY